jgi:hypothetical protein
MSNSQKVQILCSGVALGVYIPGLILGRQLNKRGFSTEIQVFENMQHQDKVDKILKNKFAFHNSFKVALTGQKLSGDISHSLDKAKIENLFNYWTNNNVRSIIVFTGYWLPIVESYLEVNPKCNVYLIHMDADVSTSWKNYDFNKPVYENLWLYDHSGKCVNYHMNISGDEIIPFNYRDHSVVTHGGGWGMGTYKEKIGQFANTGYQLNVIAYQINDIVEKYDNFKYFMIDPEWKSWEQNSEQEYVFPPFREVIGEVPTQFKSNHMYPDVYDLIRKSKAIISKPGGATLLDSLSSATPLVILEPFGKYEEKNGELWENLGLGLRLDKWKDHNFSEELLFDCHKNLVEIKKQSTDLIEQIEQFI